jgi:hypothetical protein
VDALLWAIGEPRRRDFVPGDPEALLAQSGWRIDSLEDGTHEPRHGYGLFLCASMREPLPPVAVTIAFIDCINRGDLEGLVALMTDDHALAVLDEPPLVGRDANREAWIGYFTSFPEYVIYPRHIASSGASVAVLGTTTGSHLGLPDDEEMKLDVIWVGDVVDGRVSVWRIAEDSLEVRAQFGIPPTA